MKVYLNRRSHSFINWRDEQKINVIKKIIMCWMGWLWFGIYVCVRERVTCEQYQCMKCCVHVWLYHVSAHSFILEKKGLLLEVEKRNTFSLLVTWLVYWCVRIGNVLKFFWIHIIVMHSLLVYFVCFMVNALHNQARSNAFFLCIFVWQHTHTHRFSSFLIQ